MRDLLLLLLLTACAKDKKPEVTCKPDFFGATMVRYPDGVFRKSEVFAYSDGAYEVRTVPGQPFQMFRYE